MRFFGKTRFVLDDLVEHSAEALKIILKSIELFHAINQKYDKSGNLISERSWPERKTFENKVIALHNELGCLVKNLEGLLRFFESEIFKVVFNIENVQEINIARTDVELCVKIDFLAKKLIVQKNIFEKRLAPLNHFKRMVNNYIGYLEVFIRDEGLYLEFVKKEKIPSNDVIQGFLGELEDFRGEVESLHGMLHYLSLRIKREMHEAENHYVTLSPNLTNVSIQSAEYKVQDEYADYVDKTRRFPDVNIPEIFCVVRKVGKSKKILVLSAGLIRQLLSKHLFRHYDGIFKSDVNTCFVDPQNNYTEIADPHHVLKVLMFELEHLDPRPGDHEYRIKSNEIRVRAFNPNGIPKDSGKNKMFGSLVIRCQKVDFHSDPLQAYSYAWSVMHGEQSKMVVELPKKATDFFKKHFPLVDIEGKTVILVGTYMSLKN